jgi:hypothetical protein
MAQADFRFYAELNDFLPLSKRLVSFAHIFEGRVSIKDMIEAQGVPHTEVDRILVNDRSVDFSYIVQDGDRINVYPVSEEPDITQLSLVRPKPLFVARFVLDIHLGKLATSLRMLGFDTLYRNDYRDEELAHISSTEDRILLTRDRGLLMRSMVTHGYYVRSTNPQQQVVEVLRRFDLFGAVAPFHRCLRCNGLLKTVSKESIIDQLPPQIRQVVNEFHRCSECCQIYWKGSHYERMQKFIQVVLSSQ